MTTAIRPARGGALIAGTPGSCVGAFTPPTTDLAALVANAVDAIRDTLFAARSRATAPQRNEYVRQLAKDITRERSKCIEQLAMLVADIADRGALEDAEEAGRRLVELARLVHHRHHVRSIESVKEMHLREKRALAALQEAELAMVYEPTVANEERYLVTSTCERRWRRRLDNAVRRLAILGRGQR